MNTALDTVRKYFPKVERVVDAKREVLIQVEEADRRGSKKKDPGNCAMARACKRALSLDGALISTSIAFLVKGPRATRYVVPPSIAREIVVFDRFKGFAPGEYSLRAPAGNRVLGFRPKQSTNKKSSKSHRTQVHRTAGLRQLV